MLHKHLERLALEYAFERAKPFANSAFGNFVRHDIAIEAKKHLIYLPFELTVKSSVGAGNWASIPWLAYFDPLITKTATAGFYVVYLINPDTRQIYLSMNQGTTAIYSEFGEIEGRKVLKRRAIDIKTRINDYAKNFDTLPMELGSDESLPSGYMAGHSFGRRYYAGNIDEVQFYDDLEKILSAYEALVDRGGITPTDVMQEELGSRDVEEARKYTLSRRIERSPNVRKRVLERKMSVCQGCGLDPKIQYGYDGIEQNTPLDIHHSKPISGLAEGESRRYRIPDDFLVLCPTCHRMIHKQIDPSDIDLLRSKIRFHH